MLTSWKPLEYTYIGASSLKYRPPLCSARSQHYLRTMYWFVDNLYVNTCIFSYLSYLYYLFNIYYNYNTFCLVNAALWLKSWYLKMPHIIFFTVRPIEFLCTNYVMNAMKRKSYLFSLFVTTNIIIFATFLKINITLWQINWFKLCHFGYHILPVHHDHFKSIVVAPTL